MTSPAIQPCFLGPYGENDALLEKLVVEFLRDHVYWRRNFHPEDPPAIPTGAAGEPAFREFEARMRRELHALSAALKRSVPFHSPRYIGHMVSDLLLPGLAAQFLTLPYNPNNVSIDAAPVTIDLELKVGLQLARLFGYVDDPAREDCAFGHLTSGGTLANFQALRLALATKAFPVALRAIAPPLVALPESDWTAFNLAPSAAVDLLAAWNGFLAACAPKERRLWRQRLGAERLETLGLAGFLARHPELSTPRVLAPVTAHYSWSKGMKLTGLGRAQLELVPERGMRTNPDALEDLLARCQRERQPVLMVVGVMGSTEFGTIDPLDSLVDARERWAARGLGFCVHVDAAWGGYLTTLFREPDGRLRPLAALREEFRDFPAPEVHAAVAALGRADSITVDPHKLGYIPYGAGAFLCRDQRAMQLLAEDADYVFSPGDEGDYFQRFRQLGRFIPEGSKPGAAAAAVYVTHQVLPLDHEHFGALPRESILATEAFRTAATRFAARLEGRLVCTVPFEPDSNLICLALNPAGNRDVAAMNRFVRELHRGLSFDPRLPLQSREFFGSMTTLRPEVLGPEETTRVLDSLGLDPATLDAGGVDDDRLVILRHTLMNPFLLDTGNGISYLELYFDYLERQAMQLVGKAAA
ncbi:MAG: pyridoxal-dependent decarboxylase [Arenimonas sp. SCN 70-307]|uniref:pyridoxal phosphate-dependent decarboxylase family protein n=1 Tax=Arenimonas sp. SCN 70-307 TaxID=1660089 RepID=UPI00086BE0EF|nr:pyridoxal-dependent decarboxylase [Arenimonas sp. SCN 70-307]ODS62056.1 MAG: pyridoxal-dependent decarboxylase [Arenimonas sp. SCN 70-307]